MRSLSAANTYINVFRPFFVWCQGHGYMRQNPFYGIGPYKTERKPPVSFEGLDLERMARAFDCLWRIRLALGLCGCRRGEMLSVLVKEINMDSDDPHIQLGRALKRDLTIPGRGLPRRSKPDIFHCLKACPWASTSVWNCTGTSSV